MSLSLVKRPQGYKLSSTSFTASAATDPGGVLITYAGHGLSTGDFVYIISRLDYVNGFWYVSVFDVNSFYIREYATASNVAFINSGSVTFYKSILTHNWSAVHLPIVYKLTSSLWPTNSEDTVRTASSISSDGGYLHLNLSGDIKASGNANELEWIKISGSSGGTYDGIYQIINYTSDTSFTIDLPYTSAFDLASQIQYYYMNYHANIRIYAGLDTTFTTFSTQKAYALLCEIELTPNLAGLLTLNVNEFLKQQINILKNNLALDTLPNNIDALCNFYITYAESYDKSTAGYTLGTYIGSYTSDSANIMTATNSDLPFKNVYSGAMSAYVFGNPSNPGAFLTKFPQPTLFSGFYFDLSFILNEATTPTGGQLVQERYKNGAAQGTTTTAITSLTPNFGIFRFQISQIGTEDQQIVYVANGSTRYIAPITIDVNSDCSNVSINLCWLNSLGGFDCWVFTANKGYGVSIGNTGQATKDLLAQWPKSFSETADTIDYETFRTSKDTIDVTCQYVTQTQLDSIKLIRESPLVQIVNSATDKRTVLVDKNSFQVYQDNDKQFTMTFTLTYTDETPSQVL